MADQPNILGQLMDPIRQALQQTLSNQQPPNMASRLGLTGLGYSWQPQDASAQYPYVPPGVTQIPDAWSQDRPSESRTWTPPGSAMAKRSAKPSVEPSPPPKSARPGTK